MPIFLPIIKSKNNKLNQPFRLFHQNIVNINAMVTHSFTNMDFKLLLSNSYAQTITKGNYDEQSRTRCYKAGAEKYFKAK